MARSYFLLLAICSFVGCSGKDETDLTAPYVGTYSYSYRRESSGTSTSRSGTMQVTKKSNNSISVPFSDVIPRTLTITGQQLVQGPQSVLLGEFEGPNYIEYYFTEESTGTLTGNTLNISGTARRTDSKGYTFTVKATRK